VDLLPVSALQMESFQEDKSHLPDYVRRQPRHRWGLYPSGIEETTRLSRMEGFPNLISKRCLRAFCLPTIMPWSARV
jgi:hypothetical protein